MSYKLDTKLAEKLRMKILKLQVKIDEIGNTPLRRQFDEHATNMHRLIIKHREAKDD